MCENENENDVYALLYSKSPVACQKIHLHVYFFYFYCIDYLLARWTWTHSTPDCLKLQPTNNNWFSFFCDSRSDLIARPNDYASHRYLESVFLCVCMCVCVCSVYHGVRTVWTVDHILYCRPVVLIKSVVFKLTHSYRVKKLNSFSWFWACLIHILTKNSSERYFVSFRRHWASLLNTEHIPFAVQSILNVICVSTYRIWNLTQSAKQTMCYIQRQQQQLHKSNNNK